MTSDDGFFYSDSRLYVGDLEISSIGTRLSPELLAVFTDDMYRPPTSVAGHHVNFGSGKVLASSEFVTPGRIAADRLDILGFTSVRTHEILDEVLEDARRNTRSMSHDDGQHTAVYTSPRDLLLNYTAEDWIETLYRTRLGQAHNPVEQSAARLLLSEIQQSDMQYTDERLILRLILLARPNDDVRLNITYLYADGSLESLSTLCSSGLKAMQAKAAAYTPIVVLTEGKSDIAVLEPALQLLYPHLTDLVRFMDFGQRPMGGAGPLVNTVKSFAAAGIANRVVALFDNDTAAASALRPLDITSLPTNIRVYQYPLLDLASNYPTVGLPPENTRVTNSDVNGVAGSIELYLGRDVLTRSDGCLRPVHLRSYEQIMARHQGEIADKKVVHRLYRTKVKEATSDGSRIPEQDWSGISAILNLIFHAFD